MHASTAKDWPIGVTAVMLPSLDFDEQLALCAEAGVTHYVFRPRVIAPEQRDKPYSPWGNHKFDLTPIRLAEEGRKLGDKVRDAGLEPFGTVPAALADDEETMLKLHFAGAAAAGCACVRVNPPNYPEQLFDYEQYLDDTIEHYRRAVALARQVGIKIVIEMHARTSAASPGLARLIVERFDPADLGLILDLPNAAFEGYIRAPLAVSTVAEWIDHVHVGGGRLVDAGRDARGFLRNQRKMTPLTESGTYVPEWIDMLKQLDRRPPLVIEDFTEGVPDADRLRNTAAQVRSLL